jgi:hypothetical protein
MAGSTGGESLQTMHVGCHVHAMDTFKDALPDLEPGTWIEVAPFDTYCLDTRVGKIAETSLRVAFGATGKGPIVEVIEPTSGLDGHGHMRLRSGSGAPSHFGVWCQSMSRAYDQLSAAGGEVALVSSPDPSLLEPILAAKTREEERSAVSKLRTCYFELPGGLHIEAVQASMWDDFYVPLLPGLLADVPKPG